MVRDQFQFRKKNQLKKKDRSNEQQVDLKIRKLCEKINSKKDYYTTSSCSGRINLVKCEVEKSEDAFLFKTHKKVQFSDFISELNKIILEYKKLVYFKQEPFIVHIACSSLENAEKILEIAIKAGIKKRGILSAGTRFIVELLGSEKLELPIADKGKFLVSEDYLRVLINEANSRLEKTWEKIQRLTNRI